MTHNAILRRVRYALTISNADMVQIFKLTGYEVSQAEVLDLLRKEEEEGYKACSNAMMESFLNGLIIHKRGRQEGKADQPVKKDAPLTNNAILKKIRIALELQEADMIAVWKLAGKDVSKSELTALFRKAGHKNYQECGDQLLRNFLKGLALTFRGV